MTKARNKVRLIVDDAVEWAKVYQMLADLAQGLPAEYRDRLLPLVETIGKLTCIDMDTSTLCRRLMSGFMREGRDTKPMEAAFEGLGWTLELEGY